MIKQKHVNREIEALDNVRTDEKTTDIGLLKAIVKGITLLIKLVSDIKFNQVLGLEKAGVIIRDANKKSYKKKYKKTSLPPVKNKLEPPKMKEPKKEVSSADSIDIADTNN